MPGSAAQAERAAGERQMSDDEGALGAHALEAVTAELARLKARAERAVAQVSDDGLLHATLDAESNSIAIIVRHLAGNMRSRWTDFLTTDGEKSDRNRDGEFEGTPTMSRAALLAEWDQGWACLFGALRALTPADLMQTVRIQGQAFSVLDAILRQASHYAAHVGQIVFLAKHLAWERWQSLSVPRRRPGRA
jgi:hypothetical protein